MMKTKAIPNNLLFCVALWLLASCGSSSEHSSLPEQAVITDFPSGLAVPDNRFVDSYLILLFGNSHVRSNNLPDLIRQLILAGRPTVTAEVVVAAGGNFLDERLNNSDDLRLLQSKAWTHVILQGQKYSTSGLYSYPVDGTLTWIRASKAQHSTPVLFPEHRQQHNPTEGIRVHQLHLSIAATEPTCLAPVGLAWDKALEQYPEIVLHSPDGNHAALAGSFLTALVFYQSITGHNADILPVIAGINLSAQVQQQLRQVAAATLQQHPACPF